jgi:ubiquinone/menaquinone biosynthesis C-methylase UbiE
MTIEFTAHNIRLDSGAFTKPDVGFPMDAYPWFVSARGILETVFPANRKDFRIADLGCLEGGFAVEFARMGFQVVGIDVRAANIAACEYVKANTDLPNLAFFQDDVQNIAKYGEFDAVFCCGLLYHLDQPRRFLETLSAVTRKLLILQTHFSAGTHKDAASKKFKLSKVAENEGLPGQWFPEFRDDVAPAERETAKWSSWANHRSFWIQREYLLKAIQDVGFDLVLEEYDALEPTIAESMLRGYYKTDNRGTFIGIKTR